MEHNLIFIDTETSCFSDELVGCDTYKRPHYEDDGSVNYPHISQISWIITSTTGEELIKRNFIIKPEGYDISKKATEVHGIDNLYASRHGVCIGYVIHILKNDIREYGCYKICGHNVKFDIHMIEAESLRLCDEDFFNQLVDFHFEDTCSNSKIMRYIDLKDKRGRVKRPKLSELYQYLFGKEIIGAHNSEVDISSTKECFFECVRLGLIVQMIF